MCLASTGVSYRLREFHLIGKFNAPLDFVKGGLDISPRPIGPCQCKTDDMPVSRYLRLLGQRLCLAKVPHAFIDHVPFDADVTQGAMRNLSLHYLPLIGALDDTSIKHRGFQKLPLLGKDISGSVHFGETHPVSRLDIYGRPNDGVGLLRFGDFALTEVGLGEDNPGDCLASSSVVSKEFERFRCVVNRVHGALNRTSKRLHNPEIANVCALTAEDPRLLCDPEWYGSLGEAAHSTERISQPTREFRMPLKRRERNPLHPDVQPRGAALRKELSSNLFN